MTKSWFYFLTIIISIIFSPIMSDANPLPSVSSQQSDTSANTSVSKTKPLKCPQCGIWQVDEVDLVIVEPKRIIIPGCGDFNYKIKKTIATPDKPNRYIYNVSMLLKQSSTSLLCENGDKKDWILDVSIDGHFREGSRAEFILRKRKKSRPTLILRGWNTDRENPCDAGSAIGTLGCLLTEYSHIYKAISNETKRAYESLVYHQVKKLPDFNLARFSAVVSKFCAEREKDSGGGSWPSAWGQDCELDIMKKKYQEFVNWNKCMEKDVNNWKACKFPKESFKRDPKTSSEKNIEIEDKERDSQPPQYRSFGPLQGS